MLVEENRESQEPMSARGLTVKPRHGAGTAENARQAHSTSYLTICIPILLYRNTCTYYLRGGCQAPAGQPCLAAGKLSPMFTNVSVCTGSIVSN